MANMERTKLLVMGNFKHTEVDYENFELCGGQKRGGLRCWRRYRKLMHQHVRDITREKAENEPALLDLIFTLSSSDIGDIIYDRLISFSYYMVLSFKYILELILKNETSREGGKSQISKEGSTCMKKLVH